MVNILPRYIPRTPVGGWMKGLEEKKHVKWGFIMCAVGVIYSAFSNDAIKCSEKSTWFINPFQCK